MKFIFIFNSCYTLNCEVPCLDEKTSFADICLMQKKRIRNKKRSNNMWTSASESSQPYKFCLDANFGRHIKSRIIILVNKLLRNKQYCFINPFPTFHLFLVSNFRIILLLTELFPVDIYVPKTFCSKHFQCPNILHVSPNFNISHRAIIGINVLLQLLSLSFSLFISACK